MKSKIKFVLWVAVVVVILDCLTKWLIVKYLPQGQTLAVIPNVFDIVHGRNTGAAFGLLSGWNSSLKNWFFYGIGVVAVVFLYYYLKSVSYADKFSMYALGFILGGAIGNIVDRVLRGSVVDFLSFHYYDRILDFTLFGYHVTLPLTWPAFNIADTAISIAVGLLILQNIRQKKYSDA